MDEVGEMIEVGEVAFGADDELLWAGDGDDVFLFFDAIDEGVGGEGVVEVFIGDGLVVEEGVACGVEGVGQVVGVVGEDFVEADDVGELIEQGDHEAGAAA